MLSRRIPFMVRIGKGAPYRYDKPLNTAILRSLVSGLLTQRVANTASLAGWIDSTVSARTSAGERGFKELEERAKTRNLRAGQ